MTTPTQALRGRESYDPFKNPSDIHAEKVGRILIQHYSPTPRGLTLVKRGGVWEALGSVTHDELEAAEVYYLGGHIHEITLEIGQLVTAGMVTEVTDGEGQVSFEGVANYRSPLFEEPEEEPEEPEDP